MLAELNLIEPCGSLCRPAEEPLSDIPDPIEMGLCPDARHWPDPRRPTRPRGHRLGQPPVRHAPRHRAPHGRAVPRRARHRPFRGGAGSGADDASPPRSPREGGYFRPLADHPTLAQALWTTVRELRMAGVARTPSRPACVRVAREARGARRAAVARTSGSSIEHRRADMAAVYQEAVRHPDWCPIQPQDCWTELPDANWNPLQRRLLDSLPGERLQPRAFELPGFDIPRRLKSLQRTQRVQRRAGDESARVPDDAGLCRTARSEARRSTCFTRAAAKRRSRKSSVAFWPPAASLDQVEIACASDAHLALVWEKALRHDWPVTLGAGIPATFTRPGRALLGLCDWIETDFSAGHFRRLLQSGDLSVEEHEGFTAGQAARVLARAEAGWGRATYGLALGRLARATSLAPTIRTSRTTDRADAQEKAERTAQCSHMDHRSGGLGADCGDEGRFRCRQS